MAYRSGMSLIKKACSNGHDERGSLSICSSCRLMAVPMRPQHEHLRHTCSRLQIEMRKK